MTSLGLQGLLNVPSFEDVSVCTFDTRSTTVRVTHRRSKFHLVNRVTRPLVLMHAMFVL